MGQKNSLPEESPKNVDLRLRSSELLLKHTSYIKDLKLSITKKSLSNSSCSKDISQLPENAIIKVLEFSPESLRDLMSVKSSWYKAIKEAFDKYFSEIETQFSILNVNSLCFVNSYLSVRSNNTGLIIDRVIQAEVLPSLVKQTCNLKYTYRTYKSPQVYKAEFRFDCVKSQRNLWIHSEQWKYKDTNKQIAYTKQIPSVKAGDKIEIAINWYNLVNLVNVDSVCFQPPLVEKTHLNQVEDLDRIDTKTYNIARQCEVELMQGPWFDSKYYEASKALQIQQFSPYLELKKCEFCETGSVYLKNTYKAKKQGIVADSVHKLGTYVYVLPEKQSLTHEVKRLGLVSDRNKPIELNKGEKLIIYFSVS